MNETHAECSLDVWLCGQIYVWGMGANGQLGNGSSQNELSPYRLDPGVPVREVLAGFHCTLVVNSGGTVYVTGEGAGPSVQTLTLLPATKDFAVKKVRFLDPSAFSALL